MPCHGNFSPVAGDYNSWKIKWYVDRPDHLFLDPPVEEVMVECRYGTCIGVGKTLIWGGTVETTYRVSLVSNLYNHL